MNRRQLSRPVVGIPAQRLSDGAPRGVVRVARAVAEQLAANSSIRLLAISEPIFDRNDVLFETWEMNDWLDAHSLVSPGAPSVAGRWQTAAANRSLSLVKRAITLAGLKEPARRALHFSSRIRRLLASHNPSEPPRDSLHSTRAERQTPQWHSLRSLSAILSFECYDPIWNWPVELYDCRMIGVFHDAIPFRINEGRFWNPGSYYRAAGAMVNRAAVIACDSQSSEQDLHCFFPNARHKTRVVRLGHDRGRFLPAELVGRGENRLAAQPRGSAGRRIAMIGEVEPRKNQAGVLRACRHLKARRPEERITLVLIGRQSQENPYEFLEQQASNWVDVEHLGYVSDAAIGDVLRTCDAFVYPSLWEGFGIPVLEAMSAGAPVICSNNSSLPEVAGKWAFYCDPYDPASIAAAIRSALDLSPEQRERWVCAARAHAAKFTWSASADDFVEVIEDALSAAPETTMAPSVHPMTREALDSLYENAR